MLQFFQRPSQLIELWVSAPLSRQEGLKSETLQVPRSL